MKRLIFIFLICSAGCVPQFYDYKYISLEQLESVRVVARGKSELHGLMSDDEMPIRYELAREHYGLIFEVDRKYHWPSIFVISKAPNGAALLIEAIEVSNCGSFSEFGPDYKIDGVQALRYEWTPPYHRNCEVSGKESYPQQQLIGFKVKNQAGKVLGEERIPFVLIENGIHYEIDAI